MRGYTDDELPSPIDILRGRHGYGMSPEFETDWCRAFLLFGAFGGFLLGAWAFG